MATSFTNELGQVINPGDEVVIVTTGYSHSVSTNKATYLDVHPNGGVRCVKKVKSSFYAFKDSDERVPLSYFKEMNSELNKFINERGIAGNKYYGTQYQPEYTEIRKKYMDKVELRYEFVDQRTTLKLNRIYKLAA